ncbi:transposase [Kitasatospora purpeofusca]|uniref:transposase n=1 Tax=Kitasatospora purpeofusca TaxID=67352 RepID=UPI00382303F8
MVITVAVVVGGPKRGGPTGPSPVDRGKPGSRMHVLSDAGGLPLVVAVTAGNTHDSKAPKPMVEAHLARQHTWGARYRKPGRLHADKAYDVPHLRKWLRGKRIGVRIARKGIESGERLGRRRWVIERTMCATRRSVCIPGSAGRNSEGGSWAE